MLRKYLLAPLLLGSMLVALALGAALLAALLDLPPKRVSLAAAAVGALLLAARKPQALWAQPLVHSWELLLGSARARIGLLILGLCALVLAFFAPLPWLRLLPP